MFGRLIFGLAGVLFLLSLLVPTVTLGDGQSLTGLQTFIYTLRYGTANMFGASSFSDFLVNFIALLAAAANFVFVFWALLVFAPTRITSLKWFWRISFVFLLAAGYTGLQAALSAHVTLQYGYFYWAGALTLMLVAPCVSRAERVHFKRSMSKKNRKLQSSQTV